MDNDIDNQPNKPKLQRFKQSMNLNIKQTIVMWALVSCGVVALGVTTLIIIPIILRVDYREAYITTKELRPMIEAIYEDDDCSKVETYTLSVEVEPKTYNAYVENCKKSYNETMGELVEQLKETEGVRRNRYVNAQFVKFETNFNALGNGKPEKFQEKLAILKAAHNYTILVSRLSDESTEEEITRAASYLINTENKKLVKFGKEWQEKLIELSDFYRTNQSSILQENSERSKEYDEKRKEFENWLTKNAPDYDKLASLHSEGTEQVYTEFNELYEMIRLTYQANYKSGSGDCLEYLSKVLCD